uniref:Uncharacterized protein n=1 Tax=Oryza brachyantha TaxID=4533 RepID=J3N9T7_ORYBR
MDEYIVWIIQREGEGGCKRLLGMESFALVSRHMAAQLKEIEVELEHLSKMKKRWVQVEKETALPISLSTNSPRATSGDSEQYGKRKEKLIELLNSGDKALSVIAVCGPCGSGKTHLVMDVYASMRKYFDSAAWISLAQCPNSDIAVLRKTMEELQIEADFRTESKPVESYVNLLMNDLKEKKFLFVFDDVRVPDAVRKARHTSFDNKMGSRIIIITRMPGVASDKEASGRWPASMNISGIPEFIEITCLHRDDALKLFYTKALVNSSDFPEQLQKISEKIVVLCDYLPQAIVSIGASLSLKQKTESVWSEMAQQIDDIKRSKVSLNDVQKVLYLSYKNLPMHLKNCLLYCSIFPAGFLLLPERLVRLWAAEGFIEKQVSFQLEDIAERYIKELINWGFLQVVEEDELGRLASFRMPIVVHELAVSISQKEEFGAACHGIKLAEMDSNVRCLFMSEYPEDIGAVVDFPYLRTLIADSAAAGFPSLPASLPAKLKFLTVLELQGSPLKELPRNIGYQLFNLRYLGLRKTEVQQLPDSMCRLYSLQTLDLKWSKIEELPSWIGDLTRLRHVFADTLLDERQKEFLYFNSLKAPKRLKYLKELQTLETVQASSSFEKTVEKLTQLTSLCVGNMEGRSCRTLFASLSKLSSLSSLLVSASNESESLRFQALNPGRLEKLVIRGKLADETFQRPIFKSEKLKSLELSWCNLCDNSLTLLSENLLNLESLSLHRVSGITKLAFEADNSRPDNIRLAKLRTLVLREINEVNELKISAASLPGLQVLHVESLCKLSQLSSIRDLERIQSVRNLYFPQLIAMQRGNNLAAGSSQQNAVISQE